MTTVKFNNIGWPNIFKILSFLYIINTNISDILLFFQWVLDIKCVLYTYNISQCDQVQEQTNQTVHALEFVYLCVIVF